ncbi:MAG TPA: hypothetical protein VGZ22_21545 [Isosphaeraceae bacterium]|nr:hypothetical protein [Isosphaeraceae bacterium]
MASPPTTRPKRRWLTISLRALVLLILVIAVWLGYVTNRARRQAEAVAALTSRRSWARFDYEYPGGTPAGQRMIRNAQPHGPAWLRRLVGDEYFREVVLVSCYPSKPPVPPRTLSPQAKTPRPDDDLMRQIGWLSSLRSLSLHWLEVSDEGLAHLDGLNKLEQLGFNSCPNLTDDGLAHIQRWKKLKTLSFQDCPFTDRGLAHVAKLSGLETLSIASDRITDAGLARLEALTGLKHLVVHGPSITGDGLTHLAKLPHLEMLNLTSDSITDDDLIRLSSFSNLNTLSLQGGLLTDEGLAHLKTMKSLRYLQLQPNQGQFTDRALVHLQEMVDLKFLLVGDRRLSNTHFTDSALVEMVKKLPRLEYLGLERSYMSSEALKQLGQERPSLKISRLR